MKPKKIAIIGKTNTGKSTLFNRIIGFRKAIVLKEAGITRDRNYADFLWQEKDFTLIDTGGIDYDEKQQSIQKKIAGQSKKAILDADIVLLMLDIMTGIQQEDIDVARYIRKQNKKAILVVNKTDIKNKNYFLGDFFVLGIGNPIFISAEQGNNIAELLEMIVEMTNDNDDTNDTIKEEIISENETKKIKVALIGKPNVGKSSILNALINDERIIVDNNPGTTRDSIEVSMNFKEYNINFIDTSGLRRKSNVKEKLEYYGNKRAFESIKKADIVLLVLDASYYISMQDKRLAEKIIKERKACIVILNKHDLVLNEKEVDRNLLIKMAKYELRFLKNIKILTTIAIGSEKNVSQVLEVIIETYNEYNKIISTSELNKFLQKIVNNSAPRMVNGKRLNFYYITQTGVNPPKFKIFVNNPVLIYNSYQRYLENQFMDYFNFSGVPLVFDYEKRRK